MTGLMSQALNIAIKSNKFLCLIQSTTHTCYMLYNNNNSKTRIFPFNGYREKELYFADEIESTT